MAQGRVTPPAPPWTVRTDLAVEAQAAHRSPVEGVEVEERRLGEIRVERVTVSSEAAAQKLDKPPGTYVTLHAPGLRQRSRSHGEQVGRLLAEELGRMLQLEEETSVLLVGLGNWNATPDALGPRVVSHVLVTRHLAEAVPVELTGRLRSVTALSPGVLGLTGLETGEIVRGVVRETGPDRVVCVDALAAQDPDRLCTTIQLADTGIWPGSGVGNHRAALTRQSLGVPTVAIGVPTVVHALSIVEKSLATLVASLGGRRRRAGIWRALVGEEGERPDWLREVLNPSLGRLMVTPKEIDLQVDELAWVIAGALNGLLHPGVDLSDFGEYAR